MRIRGVVLEATGGPLVVSELDLAPPRSGEVLVRLRASGVCHSDWNAVDGTAENPCPCVLGHEGAGIVEAVGEGVTRVSAGDHVALSWAPSCGECEECRRDLTQLCSRMWPAMGTGGLLDGTPRLSRDGDPVFHYSFLSTFAEACVVPERSCIPIPDDVPFDVAALVGCAVTTGVGAVWRTAGVRPGDRVAVIGCGGVGLSALMAAVAAGAEPVLAVDAAAGKLDAARAVRRNRRSPLAGIAGGDRRGGSRRVGRRRRLRDRGDRTARGDGGGVPLHRVREAPQCSSGSRAQTRCCPSRQARSRGWSGVCSARSTARPSPSATFPHTLSLYRSGRLPLDRLVSHRLPLEEAERGFELMHSGEATRVVLEL